MSGYQSSYRPRRSSFQERPESIIKRLNSPPLSPSVEEQSTQTKKLQLRKAHFQGKSVTSQHTSSNSNAWSRGTSSPSTDPPSHASPRSSLEMAPETFRETGILQEVSNSSLRRRKMRRNDDLDPRTHAAAIFAQPSGRENTSFSADNSPPVPKGGRTIDNIPRQRPVTRPVDRTTDWILSTTSTEGTLRGTGHIDANVGLSRQRTPKANTNLNRRSVSGETSRYIEHLESQLVSAQAQLSSLTSPSTTRSNSSKLRAMNEETKTLRQEILEWEQRFNERVQEQLDQNWTLTNGLKLQITTLENDAVTNRERIKVLQLECEEKGGKLEAVEGANYNLERRLEFMSELLGTSPTKINLHADAPRAARRSPVRRPLSMFSPRLPSGGGLFSPHPTKNFGQSLGHIVSPESPSPYIAAQAWEQNPFDRLVLEAKNEERTAGFVSDVSTTTLVNTYETSPHRRESFLNEFRRDADGFIKPARRMRKFYSGSQGPKTLILPATSNAVVLPTPTSMGPTPDLSFRGSYIWDVSPELPPCIDTSDQRSECSVVRARSATWTKENSGQVAQRRVSPVIPRNIRHQSVPSRSFTTPFATTEGTTKSATNRIISMGSVNGTNLFEELSRMKQDCSSEIGGSGPSPVMKRSGMSVSPIMSRTIQYDRHREASGHCTMLMERESLSHKIARRGVMWPVRRPISFVGHIADHVSQTLDTSIQPARNIFTKAWSTVTLSRPAIEFRWWLIKLLLGDMKKKGKLLQADRQLGLGISLSSTPLMIKDSQQDEQPSESVDQDCAIIDSPEVKRQSAVVGASEDTTQSPSPCRAKSSAMTWLKFSMTLVLAVGIAIRDGPSALFTTTAKLE